MLPKNKSRVGKIFPRGFPPLLVTANSIGCRSTRQGQALKVRQYQVVYEFKVGFLLGFPLALVGIRGRSLLFPKLEHLRYIHYFLEVLGRIDTLSHSNEH
jgi:hypothetical protein